MALLLWACAAPGSARAVLDNRDRGPALTAGNFSLRVTNAGILGNAFFNIGLSNDPSFEFPKGSGNEALNYAALWVGALGPGDEPLVSGGPLLEFRPTLDPDDHVYLAESGRLGAERFYDDDGDGRFDEEILNGKDDDGDGEVDEDLGLFSQQLAVADYADDQPEAIQFTYPNGELHHPLGLSVHQEAYAWGVSGYDGIAGLSFTITNHGRQTLHQVQVGLYADLDSRARADAAGHVNDRVARLSYSRTVFEGTSYTTIGGNLVYPGCPLPLEGRPQPCYSTLADTLTAVVDGRTGSGLPVVAVMPLGHTTDPMALLAPVEAQRAARAPGRVSFRTTLFSNARVPWHGVPPLNDAERYALGPGTTEWNVGETGLNGHEACIEPPPGVTFAADPHCADKFPQNCRNEASVTYTHGHCIWTDADCDICTGLNGFETVERWLEPGFLPPQPNDRTVALDHGVRIEWDNMPEILLNAGIALRPGQRVQPRRFLGYRLWKMADWRDRRSLVPEARRWALLGAFGPDTTLGQKPLPSVTDSSLDYLRILYEQPLYPVGRYAVTDPQVLNGFDYIYVVTSRYEVSERAPSGVLRTIVLESPLDAGFDRRVVPRVEARPGVDGVWVVPNPYRGWADWNRPSTAGDPLTRHIDFLGLPREISTVKIWTVAGDFVAQLDHDGRSGNGQASWDLVTRNGQEVVSGVYLFTVDSAAGHKVGRFVVIR